MRSYVCNAYDAWCGTGTGVRVNVWCIRVGVGMGVGVGRGRGAIEQGSKITVHQRKNGVGERANHDGRVDDAVCIWQGNKGKLC